MSSTVALILLALAVTVIAALGGYAFFLRKEVKRREEFRLDEEQLSKTVLKTLIMW